MQRFKAAMLAGGGFLCLIGMLTIATPVRVHSQNPPPTFNARVTNTPLPVTGSVNVEVNGTVQSVQSGNWTVGVSGTPSVSVADGHLSAVEGKLDTASGKIDATNGKLDDINAKAGGIRSDVNGMSSVLQNLSFDNAGNLKTTNSGTQGVNVLGTVNVTPPIAANIFHQSFTIGVLSHNSFAVNPGIDASGIIVGVTPLGIPGAPSSFSLTLDVQLPTQGGGVKTVGVGPFTVGDGQVITLPHRLHVVGIEVFSATGVGPSNVDIIGD